MSDLLTNIGGKILGFVGEKALDYAKNKFFGKSKTDTWSEQQNKNGTSAYNQRHSFGGPNGAPMYTYYQYPVGSPYFYYQY
jgi:hypothetical protein